jgi:tripartite-type tricarboxylate transporter receptor subunit TctC
MGRQNVGKYVRTLALVAMSVWISATSCAQVPAQASAWPTKPIRIVVPFAAGSFTDVAARAVGFEITAQTGQTVLVDNRGGAGSTVGTDVVAKSLPDGYTLMVTDNSFAISSALYAKLPYKPGTDLMAVSLLADAPAVLVGRPGLGTKTLQGAVEMARKDPGRLTFGSGGQGSSAHLAMEAFLTQNDVHMVHVPFRGISAAVMDVAADRVDLAIGSVGSTSGPIRDGRVIGLAVSGDQRQPLFPDVPTFAESGYPAYKMMYWFGVLAPAGLPPAIVDSLQKNIAKAVASPKVREIFATAGVRPVSNSPAAFSKIVADDSAMWADVIKRADIKTE